MCSSGPAHADVVLISQLLGDISKVWLAGQQSLPVVRFSSCYVLQAGLAALTSRMPRSSTDTSWCRLCQAVAGKLGCAPLLVQSVLETGLRKALDGGLHVVHAHGHARAIKLVDFKLLLLLRGVVGDVGHDHPACPRDHKVCRPVLVPKCMPVQFEDFSLISASIK